jgi:SDR family mycofactocin-dependent oxidoreductase
MAAEGADIIAVDICAQIESVNYPMATPDDLQGTVKEVENLGRLIASYQVDVRDAAALRRAVDAGTDEVGPIDIVVANAGIVTTGVNQHARAWQDVIDVNLTGVYNTVESAIPGMIERAAGGSIILISSTMGLSGVGGGTAASLGYTAAKTGLVGLMRSYANNLAALSIRVNTLHPTGVRTPMVVNDMFQEFIDSAVATSDLVNPLPIDFLDVRDVSNAVLWLASDEAKYVTGVALPVDAGFTNKK